jgi:hypothetical protein
MFLISYLSFFFFCCHLRRLRRYPVGVADADGEDCQAWEANDWCTPHGDNYFNSDGVSANDACCVCGGGQGDSGPCDASVLLSNAADLGDCTAVLNHLGSCTNVASAGVACTPSTCFHGSLTAGVCAGSFCRKTNAIPTQLS